MLAIDGGTPVRDGKKNPWPTWPVWGQEEKLGLVEVLESGIWSYNGPKETEFLKLWQEYTGAGHVLLAANGTVTLQLALEALGVGFGDEVIVPGLTWQATAAAILDVNAVPVLVDVEEDTFCISPEKVEEALTPKTKAIIPVHLYGNMADMDAIVAIAKKHDLKVIEDAAHKHGGFWKGQHVGTIGEIGSFSLQLSKLLTAGEGGILTTNDHDIWMKLDALRNCGRRPANVEIDKSAGQYGLEGDLIQSGNYRITDFQAAVLIHQFGRMEAQNSLREENARYLDLLLKEISGVKVMKEDPRESKKAYYNYVFRIDEDTIGMKAEKFRTAFSAEIEFEAESCYQPLNDCTLYRPQTKSRYDLSEAYWKMIDPSRFHLPVANRIYASEAVCFHHRYLMGPKSDMDQIAAAVKKVIKGVHHGE